MPELNGSHIEVLEKPPSALQFSRLVRISRPAVIKGFEVPASKAWSNEYLIDRMGSRKISIAVTPNGLADAIIRGPDDKIYFTEPLVEQMTMTQFLSKISSDSNVECSEVHYLQSQNGNLYSGLYFEENGLDSFSEFEPLRSDIPADISWCTDVFAQRNSRMQ